MDLEDVEPPTLELLPDDALRAIWPRLRQASATLRDALRLFLVTKKLLTAASTVVDSFDFGSSMCPVEDSERLRLPFTQAGHYNLLYHGEASLLAPASWAQRFSGLAVLRLSHLSWGGSARLLSLLHAFPCLEQLHLRFAYDHNLPDFHLRSLRCALTPASRQRPGHEDAKPM